MRTFRIWSADRTTFQSGVGFDAAVWDIWPALSAGATLCLPEESTRLSPEALRDWMVQEEIAIAFVPTAIAEQLLDLEWPAGIALRFLLTGADTLHRHPPPGLPFAFVNNYGPTECTVVTTSGIIPPNDHPGGPPPIGAPIDRAVVHILDGQGREVPPGATGEIFIGGSGVARGYRNRPDLTAERFVGEPRMYRTGDLGRFLPDGEILFFGRMDNQVKIRGYRIELEEINALLRQQPGIEASAVIVREDAPNDKRLVAYVVPRGRERDEESLRTALRRRLPDYMEPNAFVWMEALPLTPNGKVDRAALPRPALPDETHVPPRTPLEERLARIMAQVLKLERIGVEDDFFQLGAHSLLGAQVVARVGDEFGVELKLLDVFDAPTVAELAEKVEQALTAQLAAMSDAEIDAALARASDG
jgi:acyl-coenzyme A synthetase/AMP-(fatty) acid ligase/acyl carrier protein